MQSFGELRGKRSYREIVKSPVISNISGFTIDIRRNDVPVTLFYKNGVKPWKSILINNKFETSMVPKGSEIYVAASVNADEIVQYAIEY